MSHGSTPFNQDSGILCDDQGLTIRRYYPWGAKRIPTPRSKASRNSP